MKSSDESKVRKLFYSMDFVNGIRRAILYSLSLLYFLSLGYSLIAVTSLFAISTIIMILFEIPTGSFADHVSRKKSIVLSFLLLGVAFLGIFLFKDFWLLAIFWVLGDIAWTFQSGTNVAWAVDNLKIGKNKKKLATLFARFFFFEKIGLVFGGIIGFILVSMQFRFVWLAIAIINFIMAFILFNYVDEEKRKSSKFSFSILTKSYVKVEKAFSYLLNKKNKAARGITLALFIGVLALSSFFIEVPLVLTKLGLKPELISGLSSLIGVFILFAQFLGEKSAHKFGFRNFLGITSILVGLIVIIFGVSSSLIIAIICLLLIQTGLNATDAIHESAFQHSIPSNCRATLGSIMSVVWGISYALATWGIGLIITNHGLLYAGIISGILVILTGFVYFYALKK